MFPTMELRETMRLFPVKPDIKCFVTHAEDKQSKQAKTRGVYHCLQQSNATLPLVNTANVPKMHIEIRRSFEEPILCLAIK